MRCDEVMTRDVAVVTLTDTIQEAARRMRDANAGLLPVCENESEKKVLGTLTDRDIAVRAVAAGYDLARPVKDVMTEGAIICHADDDLEEAEQAMRQNQIERILVTDYHKRLIGVISLSDIAQYTDADEAGSTLRDITQREAPSPY